MIPSRPIRLIVLLLVLICTVGCDHITKHVARTKLAPMSYATLPGYFIEFTFAENPGAFLSLGSSFPHRARIAFIACVGIGLTLLFAYLVSASRLLWMPFWGLALVWAGGMSNLIDRFRHHGFVTDFVVVRVGPLHTGIFNLADLAITIGMLLTCAAALRAGHTKSEVH
jgi:signal peptidase II